MLILGTILTASAAFGQTRTVQFLPPTPNDLVDDAVALQRFIWTEKLLTAPSIKELIIEFPTQTFLLAERTPDALAWGTPPETLSRSPLVTMTPAMVYIDSGAAAGSALERLVLRGGPNLQNRCRFEVINDSNRSAFRVGKRNAKQRSIDVVFENMTIDYVYRDGVIVVDPNESEPFPGQSSAEFGSEDVKDGMPTICTQGRVIGTPTAISTDIELFEGFRPAQVNVFGNASVAFLPVYQDQVVQFPSGLPGPTPGPLADAYALRPLTTNRSVSDIQLLSPPESSPRQYRLTHSGVNVGAYVDQVKVDDIVILPWATTQEPRRQFAAIQFDKHPGGVEMTGVGILSSPFMGVLLVATGDITIEDCQIAPLRQTDESPVSAEAARNLWALDNSSALPSGGMPAILPLPDLDGPGRLSSSVRDGIHIRDCRGDVIVKRNLIAHCGDDGIATSSGLAVVTTSSSGPVTSVTVWSKGSDYFEVGDRIAVVDSSDYRRHESTVTLATQSLGAPVSGWVEFVLDLSEPIEFSGNDRVENLSRGAIGARISLNRVTATFSRGILHKGPDSVIEANFVYDTQGPGISLLSNLYAPAPDVTGPDAAQLGGVLKNVRIHANRLRRNCVSLRPKAEQKGAINVYAVADTPPTENIVQTSVDQRILQRSLSAFIAVTNNAISNTYGPCIVMSHTIAAVIAGNDFTERSNLQTIAGSVGLAPTFDAQTLSRELKFLHGSALIDMESCIWPSFAGNKGGLGSLVPWGYTDAIRLRSLDLSTSNGSTNQIPANKADGFIN